MGALAGSLGGTWLFPRVIWMGYGIMYSMGDIEYYFDVPMALFSLAAALLCSMGAAYVSCRHELLGVPASLIRPKAPKSGKRIFLETIPSVWGRLKFLHKVSIRNIVRYKKRFFHDDPGHKRLYGAVAHGFWSQGFGYECGGYAV